MRKALFGQHRTPTGAGVARDAFHPRWRRVVDNPERGRGWGGCMFEHRNESRDVSQVGAMSQLHRSWKSPMKNEASGNFTELLHIFTIISL